MKIVSDSTKLQQIVKLSLIGNLSYSKVNWLLDEDGVKLGDLPLNVAGVYGTVAKQYFDEYSPDEMLGQNLVITRNLYTNLRAAFRTDRKLTLETNNGSIAIKGARETYVEPLTQPDRQAYTFRTFPFPMTINEKYGYIPQKNDRIVRLKIKKEELNSLPDADDWLLEMSRPSEKVIELKATVERSGTYTKILAFEDLENVQDMKIKLSTQILTGILDNLDDEFYFLLKGKLGESDSAAVVFTKNGTPEIKLSYMQVGKNM